MNELISVIMSTYNEKNEWVRESIESIINQTYHNIEFIIVLNGILNPQISPIVNCYADHDRRIRVIDLKINQGLVTALNSALKIANGDYIARMDADDISVPDRLEKEADFLICHDLDIVGSNIRQFRNNIEKFFDSDYPEKNDDIYKRLKKNNCIPHSSWLVRKEVYDNLKGYRNIRTCEDYDFLLRALKKGYKMGVVADPLIYYRHSPSGFSRNRLLYQKSGALYLIQNLDTLEKMSEKDFNSYVENLSIDEKVVKKYSRAAFLYYESLFCRAKNQKLRRFIYIIRSMFSSQEYFDMNYKLIIKDKLKKAIGK